jgi:hypothetical protein
MRLIAEKDLCGPLSAFRFACQTHTNLSPVQQASPADATPAPPGNVRVPLFGLQLLLEKAVQFFFLNEARMPMVVTPSNAPGLFTPE